MNQDELNSMLCWASRNGYLEIVRLLLDKGADIHACNDNGALRCVVHNGRLEVIHTRNNNALRWAANNGHTEVEMYLLENGATPQNLYHELYLDLLKEIS